MPNHVVLALDGSEKDERALAAAAAIVELTGAELQVVRVGDSRVETSLSAIVSRLATEVKGPVSWKVLAGDDAAEALVRYAAESRPLMVVMATRAAGAAGRTMRGSVADQVMRECASPVMLVPPGAAYVAGKHLEFSRVLVPLDGSPLSARALDYVLRLPSAAALEYALLEVVPRDADRPAALQRLDDVVRRVRATGATDVDADVGVAREPAPVIAAAVRESLADIIVMSSRGASGVRRLVLGSVAEGVIRRCEVPVLLLTPASLA
ncbi:MAG TPA: universal stress protein [Gemmatimonadaceae bacterium]|nr:universal stress protein [Gemmatimonadaceae bacterium]